MNRIVAWNRSGTPLFSKHQHGLIDGWEKSSQNILREEEKVKVRNREDSLGIFPIPRTWTEDNPGLCQKWNDCEKRFCRVQGSASLAFYRRRFLRFACKSKQHGVKIRIWKILMKTNNNRFAMISFAKNSNSKKRFKWLSIEIAEFGKRFVTAPILVLLGAAPEFITSMGWVKPDWTEKDLFHYF